MDLNATFGIFVHYSLLVARVLITSYRMCNLGRAQTRCTFRSIFNSASVTTMPLFLSRTIPNADWHLDETKMCQVSSLELRYATLRLRNDVMNTVIRERDFTVTKHDPVVCMGFLWQSITYLSYTHSMSIISSSKRKCWEENSGYRQKLGQKLFKSLLQFIQNLRFNVYINIFIQVIWYYVFYFIIYYPYFFFYLMNLIGHYYVARRTKSSNKKSSYSVQTSWK